MSPGLFTAEAVLGLRADLREARVWNAAKQ